MSVHILPCFRDVSPGDVTTTNMADQAERSFQKQPTIFLNRKKGIGKKKKKRSVRYVRNVGLGFKTPREAQTGTYIDKKCPFTGDVSRSEAGY
jgi:small subunit ribosomal protein S11e